MALKSGAFDIRTVDRASLPQLNSIHIDENSSCKEKMESFLSQLNGNYCYADGDMVVGFGYADTEVDLVTKLASYASNVG